MKLVKITPALHVMPDEVSEVTANMTTCKVHVIMRSGSVHTVEPSFRDGLNQCYDNLINKINEALA
jgi:hypothetical protein